MQTGWRPWGAIAAVAATTILLAAGCGGGGSSDVVKPPQQGNGNLPGAVGDISKPPAAGDFPVASPITGQSEEAPFGTDPQYNMVPITGEQGSFGEITEVKGSSAVVIPPHGFDVLDVTMMDNGQSPDWSKTSATFNEGDPVDLWVKFNTYGSQPMDLVRRWVSSKINLSITEAAQTYSSQGEYTVKLDYAIPYVGAQPNCTLLVDISETGATKSANPFPYVIVAKANTTTGYPGTPDSVECKPKAITVSYNSGNTTATVTSDMDLTNVVLKFTDNVTQMFSGLTGKTGSFSGTGGNSGKKIQGVYVKSGCNSSTDGTNFGEYVPNDGQKNFAYGFSQMGYEDLLSGSDYDYNDFIGRVKITETRDSQDRLVQIDMIVKAVARAAGYDSDFQFNMNGAFPGQNITSIVDQYYANQTNSDGSPKRHGNQRAWRSSDGISLPIFTPIRNALPNPPGSSITNGVAGTQFIDGDYAVVKVVFATPIPQGQYTAMPYKPELRVHSSGGNTYIISLWSKKGDWVDSNGRPLAFIIPDSYGWPLEGKQIWNSYPGYTQWVQWINNQIATEPTPHWWDKSPVKDTFIRSLFTN